MNFFASQTMYAASATIIMYFAVIWCTLRYFEVLQDTLRYCKVLQCTLRYSKILWCIQMRNTSESQSIRVLDSKVPITTLKLRWGPSLVLVKIVLQCLQIHWVSWSHYYQDHYHWNQCVCFTLQIHTIVCLFDWLTSVCDALLIWLMHHLVQYQN